MRNLLWLVALLTSVSIESASAYELPMNALTYGMTSPSQIAEDPAYGGNSASTEFEVCVQEAPSSGAWNSCAGDEAERITNNINSLLKVISNNKTLPADAKNGYVNKVKTDLRRIDYLCNVFQIDKDGKASDEYNTSINACRMNRLATLKYYVTQAVKEL
ncbi:hypothetical protein [Yokenella regensburgei]|uniref:hypothetical protein n=1 Tax=Yokenella regensburgei TaxID=158877 RepID=UPI0014331D71|nr:hypothetical protein [Yokenella regensburgei]QIU88289.1 hypothetical protein HEC60_02340 [Yokenella regensburgei]